MNILVKNSTFRVITISRALSALGSYMYNIVFIVYAQSLPYSHFAIFVANMITIIPTLFTFWIGVKADNTKNKHKFIVLISFIQSIMFTLIALIIKNQTFLIFSIVGFLNVVSDVLSDYSNGLRLPMIQKNVESEKLYEAYSFTQFVSYITSIFGQTLGLWLLATSQNNYAFVAIINASSFLVSSLILLKNKSKLTYEYEDNADEYQTLFVQFKEMYTTMKEMFRGVDNISFTKILLAILIMNAMGGAISSIYNFYFMSHQLYNLNYGQSLVVVEIVLIVGAILGTLTPNDYFSKFSISKLVFLQGLAFAIVGLSNLLQLPVMVGIIFLAFAAFIMGKATPKLDALIMENLPTSMLAQSNNFLGLLFTLSLPLGIFIFSFLALNNTIICWGVFLFLAILSIVFVQDKKS